MGLIRKDSTLAELSACIDKVIAGERVFRPSVTRSARIALGTLQLKFESMALPEPLTKKESEVLALMTAGLSNKEIAQSQGVTRSNDQDAHFSDFRQVGCERSSPRCTERVGNRLRIEGQLLHLLRIKREGRMNGP